MSIWDREVEVYFVGGEKITVVVAHGFATHAIDKAGEVWRERFDTDPPPVERIFRP